MGTILTLGEILVEIMATERGQSFREPGRLLGPYPSGAPAIFIDQVGRLEHPAAMIGCVGDDDFGRLNLDRLKRDGVDTSAIAVVKDAVTGSAFVTYDRDGGRRFIFNITNSASARLSPSHVEAADLAGCSHLHVMGSSLFAPGIRDATAQAVDVVAGHGGRVSFDPKDREELLALPGMREALVSILARTDVFLPSGPELTLLVDTANETDAIRELLDRGVKEVVVKRGRDGSEHHDAEGSLHAPALHVDEVDPTGAGDCFAATWVVCRSRGLPVEESLRYANASGARAVMHKGPMEGASTLADLDALLQEAPPRTDG